MIGRQTIVSSIFIRSATERANQSKCAGARSFGDGNEIQKQHKNDTGFGFRTAILHRFVSVLAFSSDRSVAFVFWWVD
jgi:hypothetical protein